MYIPQKLLSVKELPKSYICATNQIIIVILIPVITANLAMSEKPNNSSVLARWLLIQ